MLKLIFIGMAFLFFSTRAQAAGFEKTNLVSARYTGLGSAVVSTAEGPESVFYNPAGLSLGQGFAVTLDGALGLVHESAPILQANTPVSTGLLAVPIGAAFVSYGLPCHLGFGAGIFVAGGAGGDYGNIDFGAAFPALKPEFRSLLGLAETSIAAGYEPIEGLRIGAAWRILIIRSETKAAAAPDLNGDGAPDALLATQFTGLSGTAFNGFRFGVQYAPRDAGWGLGAVLRTAADFTASGQSAGSVEFAGSSTVAPINGGDIRLASRFPLQFELGGHFDASASVRLFADYSFTYNSSVHSVDASGTPLVIPGVPAAVGTVPAETFSSPLHWHNQNQIRLGTEWQAFERWVLRAGYVFSSQVTPNDEASPFFSPPGADHTFSIGAGTRLFGDTTRLDLALEYDRCSGTASNSQPGYLDGDHSGYTLGAYLGLTRQF